MEPMDTTSNASLASMACSACRRQKRKCDKILPACGLCTRIGRVCDYADDTRVQPSSEEFNSLRQEIANLRQMVSSQCISSETGSNGGPTGGFLDASSGYRSESTDNSHSPFSVYSSNSSFTSGAVAGSQFPFSMFGLMWMDSSVARYGRFQYHTPYVQVPPAPLAALGSSTELRYMIEDYFANFQPHIPIISKIRLYQHLSNPQHEPGADMALLFLAMKLCTSDVLPTESVLTPLYYDVKNLLRYVEERNAFSIQLIQSLILVCLYEVGYAIHPAAYMTIGHACRLGYAMGLHDPDAPQMIPRCNTWTEQEERRRVWWAILILDRYINNGNRGKPFGTAEPDLDTPLPVDDEAWDRGKMLVAASLALCTSQTVEAASFARTCKAAHFMGKVGRHLKDRTIPVDFRFDEALQLDRIGQSLVEAIPGLPTAANTTPIGGPQAQTNSLDNDRTDLSFSCAQALCYSSLLGLYDEYSCTVTKYQGAPEAYLRVQAASIGGLTTFSNAALYLGRRIRAYIEIHGSRSISPLILDSLYQATANFMWIVSETSDPESQEKMTEMKELLRLLEPRWRAAGEYLRIIESSQAIFNNAAR